MQAFIPNAVATAAAYDIAPPYINDSGVAVALLKGLLMLDGGAYQCLFFVHYIGCQVSNNKHWRSVAVSSKVLARDNIVQINVRMHDWN